MVYTPEPYIIGQERAIKALDVGSRIKRKGFNIFVAGTSGTGKKESTINYVEKIAETMPTPPDLCYVNNFDNQLEPNALAMPSGIGRNFRKVWKRL